LAACAVRPWQRQLPTYHAVRNETYSSHD
jgi:hypothetical protein